MTPAMVKLDNPIRPYAWGSRTFIARLQGRPAPTPEPEAELWIGDHPRAPSRIAGDADASLAERIRRDPGGLLGRRDVERFGPTLPFLVKVLAAAQPLSLQVHPDATQARAGFAAEQAAGRAPDDPRRSYSDPRRKIELLVALEPVSALCGFRDDDAVLRLVASLDSDVLARLRARLAAPPSRLAAELFFGSRGLEATERAALLDALAAFASREARATAEARWVGRLLELYPTDVGALAPLLMNLVQLAPSQGLFIRPGTLHAYLEGSGVEVMSSSDNVVRGGLTPKHVDETALAELVRREARPGDVVDPVHEREGVSRFDLPGDPVEEFRVRVLRPGEPTEPIRRPAAPGARIVLCVEGTARLSEPHDAATDAALELAAGEAAWLPASSPGYVAGASSARARATLYEVATA